MPELPEAGQAAGMPAVFPITVATAVAPRPAGGTLRAPPETGRTCVHLYPNTPPALSWKLPAYFKWQEESITIT